MGRKFVKRGDDGKEYLYEKKFWFFDRKIGDVEKHRIIDKSRIAIERRSYSLGASPQEVKHIIDILSDNNIINALSNIGSTIVFWAFLKKPIVGVGNMLLRLLKIGINSVPILYAYTVMKLNNNNKNRASYYKKRFNVFSK